MAAAVTAIMRAAKQATDDDGALQEVADRTLKGIRERHGVYQPGWARLKPATIAKKGADTPLLETGIHSRGSWSTLVMNKEAHIGTSDPIMLFQYYGTFRAGKPAIVPRPVVPHEIRAAEQYAPQIFAASLKHSLSAV